MMSEETRTRCATLKWLGPNMLEIRFEPGIVLDRSGVGEVIQERKRICGATPAGLLLIVPHDTDLDLSVINTDHLRAHDATDRVLAFAVVAGSMMAEALLRLYKAYYPTPFQAEVFTDEVTARAWLGQRVAEALKA